MITPRRWFTCTPRDYEGGPGFFTRDSGLVCRGLQMMGVETRAVLTGSPREGDEREILRADLSELESPGWWQRQSLDGVVLYAWGRPRYRKVASAIRKAGVFLILNQDSGGLVSPLAGFRQWVSEQWVLAGQGQDAAACWRFAKKVGRGLTWGLIFTDPLRAWHLWQGDVISCVSPVAVANYRRLCRAYGGRKLVSRVRLLPHPVEERFLHDGRLKQRRIVCVGRWDDLLQKRPDLMMAVLARVLLEDAGVEAEIIGRETPELSTWRNSLESNIARRLRLRGSLDRAELANAMSAAQVFYSPSAYESFGIAAGEALCSGCSVVAGRSISMASFDWFVAAASGTLADSSSVDDHVAALHAELADWADGRRDPGGISATWTKQLHASRVASAALAFRDGTGLA